MGGAAIHPAKASEDEAASRAAVAAREEAARRIAAGNEDGAVAACSPTFAARHEEEARCRLIAAAAHLERHRFDAAAQALAPARGRLGVLEPWAALFLGEALAAQGRDEEALALLREAAKADPDGPLGRRAEVPEALALAHAGRNAEAQRRLQALLDARRGPAPRLRLALAQALEAAGEKERAAAEYRRVWRDHPESAEADHAEARIGALREAGLDIPPPDAEALVERAKHLLAGGHAARALETLAGIDRPALQPELALLRARALGGPGSSRQAEAERVLAPALAPKAPKEVRLDALELAARLAMRRNDLDEALVHLRRLEKEAGGATAREAAFLAAFFLYDAGRFAEAEKAFRAFSARWQTGRRADEAVWYTAFTLYKQAKWEEAAKTLHTLERRFPRSSLVDQAIYWRGRALEAAGEVAPAQAQYRRAIERDPAGWYAILARARLGEEAPTPALSAKPLAIRSAKAGPKGRKGARLARAEALYALGLVEQAGAELDAALAGERDRSILAAAAALARDAGDHHRAWQLGLFRLGGLRRAADLAYPEAFADEVRAAATRFSVDPHLIWSIMRQESGFRPRVRSPAAAVGLMQLLPSTAEAIARRLERPARDAQALEDPRVNVTFGTWYLGALLERFDGSLALAAAAYNAGPAAVARWMEDPTRAELPLDEFVESIPWRETRHYVKRVIANVQTYRLVHGGAPLHLRSALPEAKPGVDF